VDDYISLPTPTVLGSVPPQRGEIVHEVYEGLERNINISDYRIRGSLKHVWVTVNDALAKDPSMSTLLANKEEFQQNAK